MLCSFFSVVSESFKLLADMICEHPYLAENSKFVFVPGPQDPGPASILPRWGLLQVLLSIQCSSVSYLYHNDCSMEWDSFPKSLFAIGGVEYYTVYKISK